MSVRMCMTSKKLCLFLAVFSLFMPWGVAGAAYRPGGWNKYAGNPVFGPAAAGQWDDNGVYAPSVVYDGALYHLWYNGSNSSGATRIGHATSPDGLAWTRAVATPVLEVGAAGSWDASVVRNPSVMKDGTQYKMWYSGRDAAGKYRVGYATSPDGNTWTKHAGNPVLDLGASGQWDDALVREVTVVKVGGTYRLWYVGKQTNGGQSFGLATSPDGVTWTRSGSNPVFLSGTTADWDYGIYAPRVIYDGALYHLWYSGGNYNGTAWEVGYATSADGITWKRYGRVLPQGADGTFDRYSADYVGVVLVGQEFKLWYSGFGSDNHYRLGFASASLLNLTEGLYLPLEMRQSGRCDPVWADGFDDYHSGWPVIDNQNVNLGYLNGEYQMLIRATDWASWQTPGVQMANGVIVVHMRFASGGNNADNGGIMFGQQLENADNFYRLVVRRDGTYCIQRHDSESGWQALNCGTAAGYLPYPASNRLKVVRNGAQMTGYLNGQLLATVNDNTYTGSLLVGLSSGSSASNEDLRYDNYAVYPLTCADQVR